MSDASSFTSLLALVDSHLSQTKVSESRTENDNGARDPFPMPSLSLSRRPQFGTLSDTTLAFPPGPRLPAPHFGCSDIQSVLNEQVANMLKAKELKQRQEEKEKLAEQMKKMTLPEDDDVIDLMHAVQNPSGSGLLIQPVTEALSSSSSFESLFEPKFDMIDINEGSAKETAKPELKLPCKTDMSYILFQKVKRGKCSEFGRVLSARVKPIAAPYIFEKIEHNIKVFDFSTPSPDDIIKAKQTWKPACNATYTPDILGFI